MRARGLTTVQRVSLETLEKRLAVIEGKLNELAALLTTNPDGHTVTHTGRYTASLSILSGLLGLLVGHAEIARFVRKSPSAVRRYARHMAFPAMRFGRHVVSHPKMIFDWLWAVEKMRLRKKGIIKGNYPLRG
jgi:hypothetical protein